LEVNFSFLCDYADQSGNKLTAIGIGFEAIYVRSIPAVHPLFFAVISLKFSSTEVGEKRLGMHLIDGDGKDVIKPIEAALKVQAPPMGFLYRNQRIALALQRVSFPAIGNYSVSWLLDGREIASIPLKVSEIPQQQQSPN
jgi:hypothetical protein